MEYEYMPEEKEPREIKEILKEWAELTCKNYMEVMILLLFGCDEERHLALKIFKWADKPFSERITNVTIIEPELRQLFYNIYSSNYEWFDMQVRFGNELDKTWAMWIKMHALGITYEDIKKDSERRDDWTPLSEKGKGKW